MAVTAKVIDLFVPDVLVIISIPLPVIKLTVSSPSATNPGFPSTFQYLNVEFIKTLTLPLPRSCTSNPLSSSNLNPVTLVTVLAYWLALFMVLTVMVAVEAPDEVSVLR